MFNFRIRVYDTIKQEFTDAPHWMHLDIAGVSGIVGETNMPYLAKGIFEI